MSKPEKLHECCGNCINREPASNGFGHTYNDVIRCKYWYPVQPKSFWCEKYKKETEDDA